MKKSTFLFVFVFLGGVICANILGVVAGKELGAMNEYFMNRYMYADIQGQELFPFLFYERAPKFLVLLLLSIGIFGTFIVDGYIGYLGFSVGFLSVIAIMNYGIKGSPFPSRRREWEKDALSYMAFFLVSWSLWQQS